MRNARQAALHVLSGFARGRVPRLREALAADRLPPREQALASELVHGVARRERLLDFALAPFAPRGLPTDAVLRSALRLGAYQLLFLRGVPPHAAVHATVELLRNNRPFANAVLRRVAAIVHARAADPERADTELPLDATRTAELPVALPDEPVARLAILHSLPDFLVARWWRHHGPEATAAIAEAASAVPAVFLRACGGRTAAALQAELAAEGVVVEPAGHPLLVRWVDGASPFATRAFAAGAFLAQDGTALRVAERVPCRPGASVLDLCAAPGTKAMRLCERVAPGGMVWAFDTDAARRQSITANAQRLGTGAVLTVVDDLAAVPAVDAVLADVPCSNTGVLGRRVEVRHRLRADSFAAIAATQRTILAQALAKCRADGQVVYATCSIEPEENGEVVRAVLAQAPGWRLLEEQTTLPAAGRHDGGYCAVLAQGS